MSHSNKKYKIILAASLFIFGTLGLFITDISLPSSFISFVRAFVGSVFLGAYMALGGHGFDKEAVKRNLKYLLISGALIAFNWICLFEAYKYTGVSVATVCYYMAPVIVLIVSPFVLKEKLTAVKVISIAVAVAGAVLISGVATGTTKNIKGILLGLSAALFYSIIIICNKKITDIHPFETTLVQLSTAAVVMIPYVLLTEDIGEFTFDRRSVISLLIVGIVHTGIGYVLYFSSLQKNTAQTAAVFGYIDPATAIILSAVLLGERLDTVQIVGTVLIFAATIFNELAPVIFKRKCTQ